MARVLLVVPPFHFLDRPSLGVSLLKAGLTQAGIPCDLLYLNLRFADFAGLQTYNAMLDANYQAMLGEWVFAADLFGDRAPDPQRYVEQLRQGGAEGAAVADLALALRKRVPVFLDDLFDQLDLEEYALVGVTSTFQQNCAGLAFLQRVKSRRPEIATVLGGANCEGPMGAALHELFPFVDYVCSGEGDRVFPELVRRVLAGQPIPVLPGLHARTALNLLGDDNQAASVRDLDSLPHPDFDDYFIQLAASAVRSELQPILTLETSRGCWWGQKHHCTFCGLNGQGMTYRAKSGQRARQELDYLVERHGNRMVHVVDNILDPRYFESFLEEVAARTFPPNFYYMTKANLTKDQVRLLARAGVRDITPGIESLSSPILRLMDKGVSALQNVRLLKWCAEIGVVPNWNLLFGFPGEDPAEYQRMAELIPSLAHLQPPSGVYPVRLDRFSPNFDQAVERGFANVRPAAPYRQVYPFDDRELARLVWHFDFDYADGREPWRYTESLHAEIESWIRSFPTARLVLRVADDVLEIADSRPTATRPRTVLSGPARLAYLALDAGSTARSVWGELERTLGAEAPAVDQVTDWLEAWLTDRLVICEGGRYLSLATNPAERVRLPAERIAAFLRGSH